MILQKRIRKPPQEFISPILLPLQHQKRKVYKKIKKTRLHGPQCNYQMIPSPAKYSFVAETRLLFGDVALPNENETFINDLCLFNEFKRYKDIQIKSIKKNKIIEIHLEDLGFISSKSLEERNNITKDSNPDQNPCLQEWRTVIEGYLLSIESLHQIQVTDKSRTSKEKKEESKTRRKAERKTARLFEKYPCISLKRRFKDQRLQLTQISFSESFLALLGYSTETFTNIVLKEGIPPMQKSTTLNYKAVLALMKSHFTEASYLSRPLEFISSLIMKSGYIREIRSKMHHLSYYEDGSFGLDTVIVVISKEDPQYDNLMPNYQISKDFMKLALLEDEEASKFSEAYYGGVKHQKYKFMDKVCKVRELGRNEICKQEEYLMYETY